ncbi:MAG TPA: HAD family phosphatase [Bacteroidia bacterium]|nr:HAD family phosphatase [Bacteroidia bacterium]
MKLTHPELKNKHFNAIIFDFGAVIINIDYHKTRVAFENQGIKNFDELFSKAKQNSLFDNFEKGLITENQFRDHLRAISGINLSNSTIDDCWNKMLLQLPQNRFNLLKQLSSHIPLYLLSNTNSIHEKAFSIHIEQQYGYKNFTSIFQKVYLSHHINMRKPDLEIFQRVIHENQLLANNTLFIDDSIQHIEGATKAGIHAFHLQDNIDICDLFN